MPEIETSVADLLAFEQWPDEQKRVARAALYVETDAQRDDIIADAIADEDDRVDALKKLCRDEVEIIKEQFAVARDTDAKREDRRAASRHVEGAIDRLEKLVEE